MGEHEREGGLADAADIVQAGNDYAIGVIRGAKRGEGALASDEPPGTWRQTVECWAFCRLRNGNCVVGTDAQIGMVALGRLYLANVRFDHTLMKYLPHPVRSIKQTAKHLT